MKKRNIAAALAFSLVLAGCGSSLETTRNEAFNDLEQMSGLSRIEHDEIAFELNVATDQSGIDRAMEKAHRYEEENAKAKQLEEQKAREEAEKKDKENQKHRDFLEKLAGKTLVSTRSPVAGCFSPTIFFDPSGTLQISGEEVGCLLTTELNGKPWSIEKDESEDGLALRFDKALLDEQLNEDGTVEFHRAPSDQSSAPVLIGKFQVK